MYFYVSSFYYCLYLLHCILTSNERSNCFLEIIATSLVPCPFNVPPFICQRHTRSPVGFTLHVTYLSLCLIQNWTQHGNTLILSISVDSISPKQNT